MGEISVEITDLTNNFRQLIEALNVVIDEGPESPYEFEMSELLDADIEKYGELRKPINIDEEMKLTKELLSVDRTRKAER